MSRSKPYVRDKHNPHTRAHEHRNALRRIQYLQGAFMAPWGGPAWVRKRLAEMAWGKLQGIARVCGLGPWEGNPTHEQLTEAILAWLDRRRTVVAQQQGHASLRLSPSVQQG